LYHKTIHRPGLTFVAQQSTGLASEFIFTAVNLGKTVTKKRLGIRAPIAQFIAIIVLTISIFLVVDFGRRAAANYRVQREAERLRQEVEQAQQEQTELLAWRSYISTDLYVEEMARQELKWAAPGETVIVVLPTPEAVSVAPGALTLTANPNPQTPAQAWWHLFFGPQMSDPLEE
jgi:cell division protein FtsB